MLNDVVRSSMRFVLPCLGKVHNHVFSGTNRHGGEVRYSSDGRAFATASADGTVAILFSTLDSCTSSAAIAS